MKKILSCFVLLLLMVSVVQAQDTIVQPTIDYFCSYWPGDAPTFDTNYIVMHVIQDCRDGDVTKLCHTDDTLTVYGVAAALTCPGSRLSGSGRGLECLDTSFDKCYEYLRLYNRVDGYPEMITEARVNIIDPPAHFLYVGTRDPTMAYDVTPRRVYEVFFEKGAVDVIGDFFVGVTQHLMRDTMLPGHRQYHFTWPVHLVDIYQSAVWLPQIMEDVVFCHGGPEFPYWVQHGHQCPFIFPIVTPPGGQEGVEEVDEMAHYVNISPNPGNDMVKIASSFGMKQIEVFNSAGQRLLNQETSGLQTRLNVSGWPQDTYIVRVHTVLGTITKKLLIAR